MGKKGVMLARGDQCRFELCDQAGTPIRKRTGFITNCQHIFKALNVQCTGEHAHAHAFGKKALRAAEYTDALVDTILKAFRTSLKHTEDSSSDTSAHLIEVSRPSNLQGLID